MSSQRSHILIMSSWYPTRNDQFTGNFVKRFTQLLANDYEVSVIHTHADASCQKMELIIEEETGVKNVFVYHPARSNRFSHWLQQRKALRLAFKQVKNVDLVFGNIILNRGLQFVEAKRRYTCPLIVMEHASYYRTAIRAHFSNLQRYILARTTSSTDVLLACSEFLKTEMQPVFPGKKITVLPNYIDTTVFFPATEKSGTTHRFLHVSTLDEAVKDPLLLLKAVAGCVEKGYSQVQLTILSDQPFQKWEALAKTMNIDQHIHFTGPSSWETVSHEMRNHDAFVLCSSYETFSIVLAEAWLSGIPIITTPVGIAKNLDPALGIQIPVNDPGKLAKAMQQFMDKAIVFGPEVLNMAGQQFSKENVLRQLNAIIEQTLSTHE